MRSMFDLALPLAGEDWEAKRADPLEFEVKALPMVSKLPALPHILAPHPNPPARAATRIFTLNFSALTLYFQYWTSFKYSSSAFCIAAFSDGSPPPAATKLATRNEEC